MASSGASDVSSSSNIMASSSTLLIFLVQVVLVAYFIWRRQASSLPDLPWVSRQGKAWLLGDLRTRWWCWVNYEQALRDAYDQYARHSRACILATLEGEVVLLPPSSIPWMISQPDTILSSPAAQKITLQAKYTLPRQDVLDSLVHLDPVRPDVAEECDELREAIDFVWGSEAEEGEENDQADEDEVPKDEWKTVVLYESLARIFARASNRRLVGLPLCRDEKYIKNAITFTNDVAFSASMLQLFPSVLRFAIAPLATYSVQKAVQQFTEIVTPEILKRQQALLEPRDEDANRDLLQYLLSHPPVSSHAKPRKADVERIATHLLHTTRQEVQPTSFLGTNALLDVLAAPPSEGILKALRSEAVSVADGEDKRWNSESLAKMNFFDSALRESSRRATMMHVGTPRMVVAKGGITTPEGWHLPQGCIIGRHAWGRDNDDAIYPEAGQYKAFRFVREQQGRTADGNQDQDQLPALTSQRVKLFLAYALTRYEIQMVMEGGIGGNWNGKGVRPRCEWWLFGSRLGPPWAAKVRVKRRKEFP